MSNEAADRLMNALNAHLLGRPWPESERASVLLQQALAAERKATVERIRARFQVTTGGYPSLTAKEVEVAAMVFGDLNAILVAEAAR